MKRLFTVVMLLLCLVTVQGQEDITRFLGIPVDGSKSEMVRKLKAKGFRSSGVDGVLEGEFNGTNVNLYIVTNKNKVCRIMVADANSMDEQAIRIRFNRLCEQFANNEKYSVFKDYTIPDSEHIGFEMLVNKKRYEAIAYKNPVALDTAAVSQRIISTMLTRYTEEQVLNPTEEMKSEMYQLTLEILKENLAMRPVWFAISEHQCRYYISMYYDNEYNRANGEDL